MDCSCESNKVSNKVQNLTYEIVSCIDSENQSVNFFDINLIFINLIAPMDQNGFLNHMKRYVAVISLVTLIVSQIFN